MKKQAPKRKHSRKSNGELAQDLNTLASPAKTPKKRKTVRSDNVPTSSNATVPYTSGACHLLELPAEIRNLIYSKVIEDFPAYLNPRNHGRLVCASRLLGTNHQIRNELLGELYLTAPIHAQVYDWNFNHIVSFLNRLSTSELKTLPRRLYRQNEASEVVGREMSVKLVLTNLSRDEQALLRSTALDRAPHLERWIRRMRNMKKRRLTADVRYKVTCTNEDRFRNLVTLRCWEGYLEDLREREYEVPSRGRTELTAIRVAVLEENKQILQKILVSLQNGG